MAGWARALAGEGRKSEARADLNQPLTPRGHRRTLISIVRHDSKTMTTEPSQTAQFFEILSTLVLRGSGGATTAPGGIEGEIQFLSQLSDQALSDFLQLADANHVMVRALEVLQRAVSGTSGNDQLTMWCEKSLARERARISHAVEQLAPVYAALVAAGAEVAVIKSLDHWPDLGSDLDLYTSADEGTVQRVMTQQFQATKEPRSWGDRLANKWNFKLPGLPELIEVHVRYLGQTGEQKALARRVLDRSIARTVGGHTFRVPAPEERVIISTLQRIYRHLYFRLCDMSDFSALLRDHAINFAELKRAAELGGIWPGVATFLLLVKEYVKDYGCELQIPSEALTAVPSRDIRVYLGGQFLRVPKGPAAGLYASQLLSAGRHADLRAMFRLPLLPPLAISALVAYRLTGNDKGVW
jgi:Uncharacterised nucleotidyltransferase